MGATFFEYFRKYNKINCLRVSYESLSLRQIMNNRGQILLLSKVVSDPGFFISKLVQFFARSYEGSLKLAKHIDKIDIKDYPTFSNYLYKNSFQRLRGDNIFVKSATVKKGEYTYSLTEACKRVIFLPLLHPIRFFCASN